MTTCQAVVSCGELLACMQRNGLFTRAQTQLTLGSGTDLFDEGDWQAGGSTSWQVTHTALFILALRPARRAAEACG